MNYRSIVSRLLTGDSDGSSGRTEFAFQSTNINTCSPQYMDILALKSHLCVRMVEKRIGAEQLLQVVGSMFILFKF